LQDVDVYKVGRAWEECVADIMENKRYAREDVETVATDHSGTFEAMSN
jgi:hypothetical protein